MLFSGLDVLFLLNLFREIICCPYKFGFRVATQPFRNYSIVTIDGCRFECNSRSKCKAFAFDRRSRFCMLFDEDTESGVSEIVDPKIAYSEKKWWTELSLAPLCSTCDERQVCRGRTCDIEECSHIFQRYKGQTALLGNMVGRSSKIMYVFLCFDLKLGVYETFYIRGVCEENGGWNVPQITCDDVYDFVDHWGCYRDFRSRVLSSAFKSHGKMTIPMCASFCYNKGLRLFGLQYSVECFCGSSLRVAITYNGGCTRKCAGDPRTYCGGIFALNVYQFKESVFF